MGHLSVRGLGGGTRPVVPQQQARGGPIPVLATPTKHLSFDLHQRIIFQLLCYFKFAL